MQNQGATVGNWDMMPYFSALGAKDYQEFCQDLAKFIPALADKVSHLSPLTTEHQPEWISVLVEVEQISAKMSHLSSYLSCLGAADAHNEEIKSELARLAVLRSEQEKMMARVRARLVAVPQDAFEALVHAPEFETAIYWLRRQREIGAMSMPAEMEALASELNVTGLSAWSRLYDNLSGNLMFDLKVPGQPVQQVSVAKTRSLMEDANPAVRKAALAGANEAWASIGDTLAACLNGIAGTRLTLYRHRQNQHFLEPALFASGIERQTLDAMMEVVTRAQPMARGYLKTKAKLLGLPALGMQDTMAPVETASAAHLGWQEGVRMIVDAFGEFHPELASYAQHVVDSKWVDYDPRLGKQPGAFCSSSSWIGQSRIFMSYNGTPSDVLTLAHELGHGYHNWVMRDIRPWARIYPMTLAETASIFCEQVMMEALLKKASDRSDKLRLLDARLQDAAVFLLNIPMRFWFEESFYQARAKGELSVSRLKEMMTEAQLRAFGDSLDPGQLDPWFWASKLHFYIAGVSFYNFPYTFGYLFSLGIFARSKKEGPDFIDRYRALLRHTGSDPAEKVAMQGLGVDIRRPDFWQECIDLIAADAEAFADLAQEK